MPRRPRTLIAGGIYHVTSRGNRKEPVFLGDGDRLLFSELVRQVVAHRRWSVHCFCLMPNHYHLLVETPEPDLSAGMQRINSDYAQWFNGAHGFVGHVFQGRFHARMIESDWHFLQIARYVALNPVRAGLCASPAEWRWGSFWSVMNETPPPIAAHKILSFFGSDGPSARAAYIRFVDEGMTN
jgi:REP-associated tyrosine transposase